MNISDLIMSQLTSPDVLGKLGGLIGASESQTKTATSAAVPALLNVFAKMAGTPSGSDQLAKAMGGLDLGMLGNLAGLLGGSQASGLGGLGGNLLTSLLGNNLSSIVGTIASFAGMQPGIMKTLLTYLAPMVLGMVAKQFTGKPDAAGVSRLFSEQAGNIRGALPAGLSLGDFGGTSGGPVRSGSHSHDTARHGGHSQEAASGGLPGWLLPLLALGALGIGWYLWNQNRESKENGPVATRTEETEKSGPLTKTTTDTKVTNGRETVEEIVETFAIDPRFLEAGKSATELFAGLSKTLRGVTDEASARASLDALKGYEPLLEKVLAEAGSLPADEQPAFKTVISQYLSAIRTVVDKLMATPIVKELLEPVVGPMLDKLDKLSK